MKKKRVTPLLLLILSRTEQVGKCMEWQGMMTGPKKKLPCMWIDQPDGRKAMRSVLLLAWTELYGPPPAGHRVYRTCFNYRCVGYKRADIFYVLSERFARSSAALGAAGSSVFNMKG